MYELKTKVNDGHVLEFLESVENKRRREDSYVLLDIMTELSGETPKMWGESIIGFGTYKYQGKTSQGEWMRIAFSPRKQSMSIYIMNGYDEYGLILEKLGKHKLGKACLYINKLADVDMDVLKELISKSLAYMDDQYPKE